VNESTRSKQALQKALNRLFGDLAPECHSMERHAPVSTGQSCAGVHMSQIYCLGLAVLFLNVVRGSKRTTIRLTSLYFFFKDLSPFLRVAQVIYSPFRSYNSLVFAPQCNTRIPLVERCVPPLRGHKKSIMERRGTTGRYVL
jgi:hypothetical protein